MASDNPPERDVKDFQFQQLCKVRVSESPGHIPADRVQLLVSSSKFGLTFVGVEDGFKVLKTEDFNSLSQAHTGDRLQHIILDFPLVAKVTTGAPVGGITLSCDDLTLAVVTAQSDIGFLYFYDVRAFAGQVRENVSPFLKALLNGAPGSRLLDMAWNPAMPSLLVTCLSDGRLDMFEITDKLGLKANVPTANARCVCWSPKGKQLVAGREDGTLVQYDPDLKEKKKWDYPSVFTDNSYEALDVVWLSTYTFLVAYISKGADCSDQPQVVLINGGKDVKPTYEGFDDICYGTGEDRQRKYFFNFITKWDMVLMGSSNASEIGIVGKHCDNKAVWEHWNLDDSARAECPLTEDYVDTFPMGFTVDFTSQTPIPKGESQTYPPSPLLLVLTTDGLIIPYHMIYTHKDTPIITAHKEQISASGLRKQAGQASTDTGQLASQSGTSKPFSAGSMTASSAFSQSDGKPAFGAGGTSFSFVAPTPSSSQESGKTIAFGQPAAGSFTFNPDKNSTSTPKVTSDSVPINKPFVPAPNVNLFKPSDTTSQPLNLGLGTTSSASSSTTKPFTFTTGTVSTGFGALAAATGKTSAFTFGSQSTSTPAPIFGGTGSQATSSSAPAFGAQSTSTPAPIFGGSGSQSTSSSAPVFGSQSTSTPAPIFGGAGSQSTTTSAPAFGSQSTSTPAPIFGGAGSQSTTTSAPAFGSHSASSSAPIFGGAGSQSTSTSAPPAFGTSSSSAPTFGALSTAQKPPPSFGTTTSSSSIGVQKPTTSLLGTPTQPSVATGSTKTTTTLGSKAGVSVPPFGGTGTALGSMGAGVKPPPSYTATTKDSQARAGSPVQAPSTDRSTSITASVDHSFSKSIAEEMEHFEKEMRDLKGRASRSAGVVGNKEEITLLKKKTENISNFWTEIRKTTQEQSKEVQDQRNLCLDMFAMGEECRSREQLNSDPKYSHLLKSQALDPGSLDKLQQLQLQYQVLDQGVRDVDLILDTQWEEYQQRKKNKTNRLQRPSNDAIYRIVKSNQNIMQAQKTKLRQLEESLKQLKVANQTSTWQPRSSISIYDRRNEQTELSTLADSLVNPSVKPSISNTTTSHSASTSSINQNKLVKLREHLYRRHVPVIKSTRPENLSMSRLLVPEELLQQKNTSQQPQGTEVKSAISSGQAQAPSFNASGNFVGMQRRSSPSLAKIQPSSGVGLNQSKEPGLTINQQNKPGFNLNTAQSTAGTSLVSSKPGGLSNVSATKPPSGSQLGSKFVGAPSTTFDAKPTAIFPPAVKPAISTGGKQASLSGQGTGLTTATSRSIGQNIEDRIVIQPTILTNVKEINGQTFDDITPEDSTETGEDDYEEDDEYDDEDSNGIGFGLEYMPALQGGSLTASTPLSTRPSKPDGALTPVSRKLFGGELDVKPASGSFKFGADTEYDMQIDGKRGAGRPKQTWKKLTEKDCREWKLTTVDPQERSTWRSDVRSAMRAASQLPGKGPTDVDDAPAPALPTTFSFGAKSAPDKANTDTTKKEAATSKPFVFASSSTSSSSGFNFSMSSNLKPEQDQKLKLVSAGADSFNVGKKEEVKPQPDSSSDRIPTQPTGDVLSNQPSTTQGTKKTLLGLLETKSSSSSEELSDDKLVSTTVTVPPVKDTDPTTTSSGGGDVGVKSTSLPGGDLTGKQAGAPTAESSSGSKTIGTADSVVNSSDDLAGDGLVVQTVPSVSSGGVVGQAPTAASTGLLGQGTTASTSTGIFGQTTSSSTGLFGQNSATSSTGLFGKAATSSGTGVFGGQATTTSATGVFGQATTSASGLFGQATTTSAAGVFGQATTTSSTGVFGQGTTTPSTGLFGQATTTSASGVFGQATTTSASGVFGQATTTAATGLFGQATTTPSTGLFGQATTASSTGLFGQTTTTNSSGVFGQTTATPSTGLFGQASTTTGSTGLFGQTTSSGGLFGTTTTASSSGGVFGQPTSSASSPFAGGSGLFGQPASTSSSVFGQPASSSATSTGGFGSFGSSGGSPFAAPSSGSGFGASTSGAGFGGFGQASPTTSGFGGFGQSPSFGQTPRSGSGFGSTESGSGGALFTGLGGKPSAEKAGTNVFGATQSFGSSQESSGLFGSGGAKTFGTAATSSAGSSFSGGSGFTGGGSGLGTTSGFGGQPSGGGGFGSPPSFGGPAFGGAPKFGSGAAFGGQPAFGSGATFGSAPTFGSSAGGSTFGSASPSGTGGFASFASGSSPTFGALAQSSDAPTFGSLNPPAGGDGGNVFGGGGGGGFGGSPSFGGQQQQNTGFGGNAFGSSPSFSGYRG